MNSKFNDVTTTINRSNKSIICMCTDIKFCKNVCKYHNYCERFSELEAIVSGKVKVLARSVKQIKIDRTNQVRLNWQMIKYILKKQQITYTELATAVNIGKSQLQRRISGVNSPWISKDKAISIAKYIGVNIAELREEY